LSAWLQSQQYESSHCRHPSLLAPHFVWQHYLWTFPTNLQMLNGLQSMNKETGNEIKIVDFGDNNYKKGNVASSAENFIFFGT
jgi:hypothetical protein